MTVQRALGSTVRHLRRQKGIAQEALALDTGIARSHMSAIERGVGNPTLLTILRLLRLLEVNFQQFGAEIDRRLKIKPHPGLKWRDE